MTRAGHASVDAVRASLVALAEAPADDPASVPRLESARRLWDEHCATLGLQLLDDHDPHVAPGLHVARTPGPLTPGRVRQLARSWETFDRAFEACPLEVEQRLFDERIAPCFLRLGAPLEWVDLAEDHAFVIDERYVALFPAERWTGHAARHRAPSSPTPDPLVRALRRVCGTPMP